MNDIEIDTSRLDTDLRQLDDYIIKYNNIIDSMFHEVESLISSGWSGDSANEYIKTLANEKTYFENVTFDLKKYSNMISKLSKNFDVGIRKSEAER